MRLFKNKETVITPRKRTEKTFCQKYGPKALCQRCLIRCLCKRLRRCINKKVFGVSEINPIEYEVGGVKADKLVDLLKENSKFNLLTKNGFVDPIKLIDMSKNTSVSRLLKYKDVIKEINLDDLKKLPLSDSQAKLLNQLKNETKKEGPSTNVIGKRFNKHNTDATTALKDSLTAMSNKAQPASKLDLEKLFKLLEMYKEHKNTKNSRLPSLSKLDLSTVNRKDIKMIFCVRESRRHRNNKFSLPSFFNKSKQTPFLYYAVLNEGSKKRRQIASLSKTIKIYRNPFNSLTTK